METIVKQATLIRVDTIAIERQKQGLENRSDLLNEFREIIEKTLKTILSHKEKTHLKENGFQFVND